MDLRERVVILDSHLLALTGMEYGLLTLLVEHAGEVVPRRVLLMLTPTVDVNLWRLRRKLGIHFDRTSKRLRASDTVSGLCQGLRARCTTTLLATRHQKPDNTGTPKPPVLSVAVAPARRVLFRGVWQNPPRGTLDPVTQ